jgi:8-oxo-dGTP diphosphatase
MERSSLHSADTVTLKTAGSSRAERWKPEKRPNTLLSATIEEELNVEIQPEKLLHTVEYDYPNFHLTMHCFISVITKGTIELIEHEDAKWLKPDELDSVAWLPADVEVVEKLKVYLKEKN